MKIIALQAENLKRLVAVEIKPDGNLVQITGKNGQGKTSVLDAIWWALEGATHIQAVPIRKGATEALIRLDLGEIKVTRKFRAKEEGGFTTTITVENAEGARFPSPQAVLDALIGELSFDPLAFTRMKPPEQFETLKRFVPDIDFDAIEKENNQDFAERTAINRDAKALRAQAAGIVIDASPAEPVDESALVEELANAGTHNATIETRRANRDAATTEAASLERAALDKKAQADALYAESADMVAKAADLKAKLLAALPLPAAIDTADLLKRIDAARATNASYANVKRRRELETQAEQKEASAVALTKAIEKRDAAKAQAIRTAKMPVEGITFGLRSVLLNDVPFDQASDAQQLQASIAIAAAMNPKLRVIRVRDGSLLDDDALALLAKYAEQADMQIWIERVDGSGSIGFVLEDGQIKAAKEQASEAA